MKALTKTALTLTTFAFVLLLAGAAFAQDYTPFSLGAGFMPDPQTGTGDTGGPVDAGTLGCPGLGWVDSSPDHVLTVTSPVNLKLYVTITDGSGADPTLVINGAATLCDDDSHGYPNPEINAVLQPGVYNIYVGQFNAETRGRYLLTLTENL